MNRATVTTTRFGPTVAPETLRAQGKCFVTCGIVLMIIGVALIIVTAVTVTFIVGPAVVVLVWGIICIFIGWRRMNMARMLESTPNRGNVAPFTVTTGPASAQFNHAPVTVYQRTTTATGVPVAQQGFVNMPPTQFSTPGANTSMFSNECPPYPTYGMYPTQASTTAPAPPSYEDATKS